MGRQRQVTSLLSLHVFLHLALARRFPLPRASVAEEGGMAVSGPPNHGDLNSFIHLYLTGNLSAQLEKCFEAHLSHCIDCWEEVAIRRVTLEWLRTERDYLNAERCQPPRL